LATRRRGCDVAQQLRHDVLAPGAGFDVGLERLAIGLTDLLGEQTLELFTRRATHDRFSLLQGPSGATPWEPRGGSVQGAVPWRKDGRVTRLLPSRCRRVEQRGAGRRDGSAIHGCFIVLLPSANGTKKIRRSGTPAGGAGWESDGAASVARGGQGVSHVP